MSDAPDRRILPYVSTVILLGGLSAAWLLLKTPVPYGEFLSPVIFVFTLCSIVGEAVPLKVFRGNMEGELSTSTTFAVAMMLVGRPGGRVRGAVRRQRDRRPRARQAAAPDRVQHRPVRDLADGQRARDVADHGPAAPARRPVRALATFPA